MLAIAAESAGARGGRALLAIESRLVERVTLTYLDLLHRQQARPTRAILTGPLSSTGTSAALWTRFFLLLTVPVLADES